MQQPGRDHFGCGAPFGRHRHILTRHHAENDDMQNDVEVHPMVVESLIACFQRCSVTHFRLFCAAFSSLCFVLTRFRLLSQ